MIAKQALIKISIEYTDFVDVFSPDLVFKLHEYTRINDHIIGLVDNQEQLYKSIYSLELVELKILQTYLKKNLANKFIKPSIVLIDALIFFDQKSDKFF